MRDSARIELDRIDALKPGTGLLEAYAGVRGNLMGGLLGGFVEYGHRVTPSLSIFGRGSVGYRYGNTRGLEYSGELGGRYTF